jgi:hypothetical protein
MNLSVRVALFLAVAAVAVTGVALAVGPGDDRATAFDELRGDNGREVARPLAQSTRVSRMVRGVVESAKRSGVVPTTLVEAGTDAIGGRYATTIVGKNVAGEFYFAFATTTTSGQFFPARAVFGSGTSLYTNEYSAGSPIKLHEVGVMGAVSPDVARLTVMRGDGTTEEVPLTVWPGSSYASFAIIGVGAANFPTLLCAYDASGSSIGEDVVDTQPLCPAVKPRCID